MPTGLKPWKEKVDAVLRLQPPNNVKQVCSFIGSVNYYRDMFPRQSHQLAPLTALTGKGTFHWNDIQHQAFDILKAVMILDCLLCYPDHNKPFHIYIYRC
jgi:hypothetical protein